MEILSFFLDVSYCDPNYFIQSEFETYAEKIKTAGLTLSNEQKGKLYGLYKQATMGDNSVDKPGLLSGFEARGKWDSWEANKGMSKEDAEAAYVAFCKELMGE